MRPWVWLLLALACGDRGDDSAASTNTVADNPNAQAPQGLFGLVDVDLSFDAPADTSGDLVWTFGDGDSASGAIAVHRYDRPGHYTAFLQATAADGVVDTASFSVTITWPVLDRLPHQAATLNASADRIYVVLPDFNAVAVVDRADGSVLSHVSVCDQPRTVDVSADAFAVACAGDDTVQRYDLDGQLLDSWSLGWGARPYGVVFDGDTLAATLQGAGQVVRLSPGEATVTRIDVGPDLRGLASVEGVLWVTRHRSEDSGGSVFRIDSDDVVTAYELPFEPGPDSDTNSRGVPTYLQQIAIRPDGRVAFFPGLKANIQRGLARDGLPLTFETSVRSDLRQLSVNADEAPVGSALGYPLFDDRGFAVAARFSPRADWLWVVHQGMESVDLVDPYSLERAGAVSGMGTSPDGVFVGEDQDLWVSVGLSRRLVRYDVTLPAAAVEVQRIDLLPPGGEVVEAEVLRGQQIFQRSLDPRMSADGYVSCASCHLDGDHDRRVWDFTDRQEGLRNTISMKGRAGAAPIHWSANFDEVHDFENDIRGPQSGQGFLSPADWQATSDTLGLSKAGLSVELDAMAAYAASLDTYLRSPFRNPDGSLTTDALAGAQIFQNPGVGCVVCHSGPEYTDSQWLAPAVPLVHDVGTITADSGQRMGAPLLGIDTPGLRGLFNSPPYLHDGSAPTVMAVLVDRNPNDAHGVTSALTAVQLRQLERFLLELQ